MGARLLWGAACATVLWGTPTSAAAQPQDELRLRWDAPADCPSREHVIAGVRRHLGRAPNVSADVAVEARVRRTPQGAYVLSLGLWESGGRVEREIVAGACETLADAAALLIALSYDPNLAGQAQDEADQASDRQADQDADQDADQAATTPSGPPRSVGGASQTSSPRPRPGPNATSPAKDSPLPETDPRWDRGAASDNRPAAPVGESGDPAGERPAEPIEFGLDAGLEGALGFGLLPRSPALGLRVAVGLAADSLRFEASGTFWPPQTRRLALPTPGAEGDLSALLVGLRACYLRGFRALTFGPCVGVEAGQLSARTRGIDVPETTSASLVALGGGLSARGALVDSFAVTLDVDLTSALERPHFFVASTEGSVDLHTPRPVLVGASLGLSYAFF